MSEVGFYHLTRTPLAAALPPLLTRTLAAGERGVVKCGDAGLLAALDEALWALPGTDWLPHGTAADGDAALQPIWLASDESAPNGARFLFLVGGAEADRIERFARVFDLFDGGDTDAVAAARRRWSAARDGGHTMTYWQQGERGWVRKA